MGVDPRGRQTRVNGLEVDFYWPSATLCVEIDGDNHKRARTAVDDRPKDAALHAAGYAVLRFTEDELTATPRRSSRTSRPHFKLA